LWKRLPRFLVERVRAIGQPSCEGGKALAGQVDPVSEESEEEGFAEVNLDDIVSLTENCVGMQRYRIYVQFYASDPVSMHANEGKSEDDRRGQHHSTLG
jgi:hypothetical protein